MAFLIDLTWNTLLTLARDIETGETNVPERGKTCMLDIQLKLTNVSVESALINPTLDVGEVYNRGVCNTFQSCTGNIISHKEQACIDNKNSALCITDIKHRNCATNWTKVIMYIIFPTILGLAAIAFLTLWLLKIPINININNR